MDHIGEFAARVANRDALAEKPLTLYHRIESKVAERFVTRCGREMDYQLTLSDHLVFAVVPPAGQRCARC